LSLSDLDKIIIKYNKVLKNNYYISTNVNLTYDFVFEYIDTNIWSFFDLSRYQFPAEVNRENTIKRIKNNYLNRKKRILLNKYMIFDLNNIIIEY
jgi:hypothetical protein